MKWFDKMKCKMGIHRWFYVSGDACHRECSRCKKIQMPGYDMAYGTTNWK